MKKRLAIVTSHVIQYQDPLFKLAARSPEIDLTVLFCSRHGAESYRDEDMQTDVKWDLDLLTGYRHEFLRNLSPIDLSGGFFRLINPGILPLLLRSRFDAVVFMIGWGSFTAWLGFLACILSRTPFFLYGDSSFPPPAAGLRGRVRAAVLRLLFRHASGFMVSGVLNADYYRHYGADEHRFFLLPWAVDNDRFLGESTFPEGGRTDLRRRHGAAAEDLVIIFSAKLVGRKDPETLVRAISLARHRSQIVVVFLGDGELRESLQSLAANLGVRASFPGFLNQSALPQHYAMGDLFVLPSLVEPRGAVINEAMACGLPVVVTDRCGSIGDIVLDRENALIYPAGEASPLAQILDLLWEDRALLERMSARSREIIRDWSFSRGVQGLEEALRRTTS